VERLLPQDRGGEAEEEGGARENGARDEVKKCHLRLAVPRSLAHLISHMFRNFVDLTLFKR